MEAFVKKLAVIGAGPTSVGLISTLIEERALKPKDIVVIDPLPPLVQFGEHIDNIGMRDMRSPWTVSVQRDREAFYRYAEDQGCEPEGCERPPWEVFRMHAQHVWGGLGVEHVRAKALSLSHNGKGWEITLDQGKPQLAKRVVVATGLAPHRKKPLQHTFPIPDLPLASHRGEDVAVIGGGMTATNAAFTLIECGARVTLFAPDGVQVERSGLNAWITGPQGDGTCISEGAEDARRRFIDLDTHQRYEALKTTRIEGTVTLRHQELIDEATRRGLAKVVMQRVVSVQRSGLDLTVKTGALLRAEHGGFRAVYDARGFNPNLDAVSIEGLREAIGSACFKELPLIDDRTGAVKGQPTLYFAGALSAMSFGPAASTVAGGTMLGHVMADSGGLR